LTVIAVVVPVEALPEPEPPLVQYANAMAPVAMTSARPVATAATRFLFMRMQFPSLDGSHEAWLLRCSAC
jgi:hypothetical protein